MILITLGTQDKPFNRLLEEVQRLIDNNIIKDKIIVQAGYTKFKSKDMEIFKLIPMSKFDKLVDECDLLITHGGVGSIITGLNKNKKVIAVPRLSMYNEHVNDHQKQIINNFNDMGYIIGIDDVSKLNEALKKVNKFKPKKYKSNNGNMVKLIKELIENNK